MVSLPIVNVIRVSIGGPKGRRGGLGFGGGAGTDVDEWDPQSAEPRAAAANANYKFAPAPKKTPAAPGAKKGTRRRIANNNTVFIVLYTHIQDLSHFTKLATDHHQSKINRYIW